MASGLKLERAVVSIAGDIAAMAPPPAPLTEAGILEALAGCILSSRVRHQTCVAAVERLRRAALFANPKAFVFGPPGAVEAVLAQAPLSHPWPKRSAQYLLASMRTLLEAGTPVAGTLGLFPNAYLARDWLVDSCPGLGAKQASLFLRKVGCYDELAVLDVHVLRFMRRIGLVGDDEAPRTAIGYARLEGVLQSYARAVDVRMPCLDTAIWIVMRAEARGGAGVSRNLGVGRAGFNSNGVPCATGRPSTVPALC